MSLGCSVHRFIKHRLNDGSIALKLYSCSGCAGVFRQLLWFLICSPSTYFSFFEEACFSRNLLTASFRHYRCLSRNMQLLGAKSFFPTEISGSFAIKGKIFTLCLQDWFILAVYFPMLFSGAFAHLKQGKYFFLWNPVKSLEIVLWYDLWPLSWRTVSVGEIWGRSYFLCVWQGTGTGSPGKLWMPVPPDVQGQAGQHSEQPGLVVASLPMAAGLELDDLWRAFQPKPFYDCDFISCHKAEQNTYESLICIT